MLDEPALITRIGSFMLGPMAMKRTHGIAPSLNHVRSAVVADPLANAARLLADSEQSNSVTD